MMSKEKRRVPKLRFPGFTEDWEQRKLRDIVDFLDGQRKPLKESDRIKGKYPYYGASGIIDYINDYLFDENLVLLSEDGANIIDRNYPVCFIATGKYWVNNHAHVLKVKAGVIDKFICESLERLDYTKFNTGTAQPKLNQDICQKIVITIPNEDEQKCISEFLDRINNIITLHQRKLDNLKLKKKALLQKLFPKNGDRYPELRFPGFTDAWEQRKLSDITYLSGIKNKENKPYESYSISNEFGFIPQAEQFENGGTMKTADKSMYYIVSQNSFAYNPARINVGSIGYYDKPDNVIVSSLYEVFKTTDIVNDKFLWHWFKSNQFNRLIGKYQEGGVRLYFYYDKLCKGTMGLPAINEQNKISNLLDDLDMYITLHQRKLDHLQLQKKALLQQIFV